MTLTCYKQKGLVTRSTHVKYEGPYSYQSKDMANVKVFANKGTRQKPYAPDLSMQGLGGIKSTNSGQPAQSMPADLGQNF